MSGQVLCNAVRHRASVSRMCPHLQGPVSFSEHNQIMADEVTAFWIDPFLLQGLHEVHVMALLLISFVHRIGIGVQRRCMWFMIYSVSVQRQP